MIGAHSRVSIQQPQRSVLSKRHLVRTFYYLIPSVRDLCSPPHSNRTPGSKFKCCRRRDARCSHRQLGMIGTIEYLIVVCVAVSWQSPNTCNLYIASTHLCKQKKLLCHHQQSQSRQAIWVEYPVLVKDTYFRPRAKVLNIRPQLQTSKDSQSALPVTMTLPSPDAVDSNSMFRASAHPSHAPHVPHASSRTTDSTLAP